MVRLEDGGLMQPEMGQRAAAAVAAALKAAMFAWVAAVVGEEGSGVGRLSSSSSSLSEVGLR